MSQPRSDIDLDKFARGEGSVPRPRRRWSRFTLPALLLLGFTIVLLWSLGDMLRTPTLVTVLRPAQVEGDARSGTVAFQAAGWVEPEPFPRHVVPLTAGTVAEILVQESDHVQRGDVVARLVADDPNLEFEQARATLRLTEAERDRARSELSFANEEFEAAIQVTEQMAIAEAEVASRKAESTRLEEVALRTRAEVRVAEEELEIQRLLAQNDAAGPRQVELAQAKAESARAAHASAAAAAARAEAEISVAVAKLASASTEHELRISDRRAVALAETGLAVADAKVTEAAAALELARLRRARVEVTSPWDGVVLERLTLPGATVGGQGLTRAAICSIYDPTSLRVRVDVAQEEVGMVAMGQKATIRSESRRDRPYEGTVVRVVHRADIQKVTLQVHVKVEQPDALLRPEMLCQVRFEAVAETDTRTGDSQRGKILRIPARLPVGGDRIWVLDATENSARLRTVTAGSRDEDWVEILTGLNLSDKLIDEGRGTLEEGTLVRVQEINQR